MISSFVLCGISLLGAVTGATPYVVLVPLDSRPATSQYPEMLASIAGVGVVTPPKELLGRFTIPGKSDFIARWMLNQDYKDAQALIVSADMLCYGGLVESRLPTVSTRLADLRLDVLRKIRQQNPRLPIYVYASLMRTTPTATTANEEWRAWLSRYVALKEKHYLMGLPEQRVKLQKIETKIPEDVLERYYAARERNLEVSKILIDEVKKGVISYLAIGTDDSLDYGPQRKERWELRKYAEEKEVLERAEFCEGVDQLPLVLLSRLFCLRHGWSPRVFVQVSNPMNLSKVGSYETIPLATSIRQQVMMAGGEVTTKREEAQYILYVYLPQTTDNQRQIFLYMLQRDLRKGVPVALVDINFDAQAAGDPALMNPILFEKDFSELTAYSSWNTPANSLGTAIAHAHVILFARKTFLKTLERESAHYHYLLMRLVNDYGYARLIRPDAYRMLEEQAQKTHQVANGEALMSTEKWVAEKTKDLLREYFEKQFLGKVIEDKEKKFEINGLEQISVSLPWPRAFECEVDFKLSVKKLEK